MSETHKVEEVTPKDYDQQLNITQSVIDAGKLATILIPIEEIEEMLYYI